MLNAEHLIYEEIPPNNESRNNIRYILVLGIIILVVIIILVAKLLV